MKENLDDGNYTKNNLNLQKYFSSHRETFQRIRELLDGIDINRLIPVEALMKLNEIKEWLK